MPSGVYSIIANIKILLRCRKCPFPGLEPINPVSKVISPSHQRRALTYGLWVTSLYGFLAFLLLLRFFLYFTILHAAADNLNIDFSLRKETITALVSVQIRNETYFIDKKSDFRYAFVRLKISHCFKRQKFLRHKILKSKQDWLPKMVKK